MKLYCCLLLACLLSGCASIQAPPTMASPESKEKKEGETARYAACALRETPNQAIECARKMQSAYLSMANELDGDEKHAGLALGALGVGAAVAAAFGSHEDTPKALGAVAALIQGQNLYLAPQAASLILDTASGQMDCVVRNASALMAANATHISSMQQMYVASEAAMEDEDPALRALGQRAYSLCEYSDAGQRVGGQLAYGEPTDPPDTSKMSPAEADAANKDARAKALTGAAQAQPTALEIYDVMALIEANTLKKLRSVRVTSRDPRADAQGVLDKYFKQQEQQEAMQEVGKQSAKVAESAKDADGKPTATAKMAADLKEAAEGAAATAKVSDQQSAKLAACAAQN